MNIHILIVYVMILFGLAMTLWMMVRFSANELRLKNLPYTVQQTRSIPFFVADEVTDDVVRVSLLTRRDKLLALVILGNIAWILIILLHLSALDIHTMIVFVVSYIVLVSLFSIIMYYIICIYYARTDSFYTYTAFLPQTI